MPCGCSDGGAFCSHAVSSALYPSIVGSMYTMPHLHGNERKVSGGFGIAGRGGGSLLLSLVRLCAGGSRSTVAEVDLTNLCFQSIAR
eukprot:1196258-Prorocentrum_minimum.AAC.12